MTQLLFCCCLHWKFGIQYSAWIRLQDASQILHGRHQGDDIKWHTPHTPLKIVEICSRASSIYIDLRTTCWTKLEWPPSHVFLTNCHAMRTACSHSSKRSSYILSNIISIPSKSLDFQNPNMLQCVPFCFGGREVKLLPRTNVGTWSVVQFSIGP